MRVPGHQRKSYPWRWTAALAGLAVLSFALVMALVVQPAERVEAAPFTVNLLTDVPDTGDVVAPFGEFNAGDTANGTCDTDAVTAGNQCTLRAAIFEANGNGDTTDNITFGTLAGTISLSNAAGYQTLPLGPTTAAGAPADGTTIDGNLNVTVSCAAPFVGFTVTGGNNVIRDLAITGCTTGIRITGEPADGNFVRGNRIGTNLAGTAPAGNTADGVAIVNGADNNTVGGTITTDQNIISANAWDGVWISGLSTTLNTVLGNLIGLDVTGTADFGNSWEGVEIAGGATSNVVGGTTAGSRNIISGNDLDGVLITGAGTSSNIVQGNCIGTQVNCANARPNTVDGVRVSAGASDNFVGTGTAGSGNVIANNLGEGVGLLGGAATDDNMISRNSMSGNGDCGIRLPAAENDLQGAGPVPTSIIFVGGTTFAISGTGANPGGTVQAFISSADPDPAGPAVGCGGSPVTTGEGSCYVGEVGADATGAFTITVNNIGGASNVLTMTNTTNSTSEFGSPPFGAPAGPGPGVCPLPAAAVAPTPTPAPTNTTAPAATSTTVPSTATRTPTPGAAVATATRTPTTGAMESVALAGNVCNPVASSYADDTAIATIAGAVSPSGILVSIWWFDSATLRWLGYDPLHPANPPSDLTLVDRLDAIFICVSTAGTWSRPVI